MSQLFNRLPTPRMRIIGHRGIAARAPENTIAGFKAAAAFGLNWVEFDIQRCATGEWVVFHDESLERTTNSQGLIKSTPYEKLKDLDAGSWFDLRYKEERIPKLEDALICLARLKLHPNIEIKVFAQNKLINPTEKKENMLDFLRILQATWPKTIPKPLVSSFDLETLQILRSLDNTLPLGYVIKEPTENTLHIVIQEKINSLHCSYQKCSLSLLTNSKTAEIPILVYTVNNSDEQKKLLQMGVTAIFSDLTNDINN